MPNEFMPNKYVLCHDDCASGKDVFLKVFSPEVVDKVQRLIEHITALCRHNPPVPIDLKALLASLVLRRFSYGPIAVVCRMVGSLQS